MFGEDLAESFTRVLPSSGFDHSPPVRFQRGQDKRIEQRALATARVARHIERRRFGMLYPGEHLCMRTVRAAEAGTLLRRVRTDAEVSKLCRARLHGKF